MVVKTGMEAPYYDALKLSNKTYEKRMSELTRPFMENFYYFANGKSYDWVNRVFPYNTKHLLNIDYDFGFPEGVFPEYLQCKLNVLTAVEIFGGRAICGWQIQQCKDAFYWATEHWLWEMPSFELKDITPAFPSANRAEARLTVGGYPIDYISRCNIDDYKLVYNQFVEGMDRSYLITDGEGNE